MGFTPVYIHTKNDRWLQYVLLLSMQQDWDAKEKEFLAEQEAARKAAEEEQA